ncbi:MAG: hypothetical protein RBT63_06225, partial [Bdellovibrionales bacterium]|nr:hypothetical protein [Bdellovibrionales bacterium]
MIDKILELALRSPSGDNCQPWVLRRIGENTVAIGIDRERDRHVFNNRSHASLLSLGMFVQSIEMVGPEFGYDCRYRWLKKTYEAIDETG